jgi:hypothetical protein
MTLRSLRWTGHIVCKEEMKNAYIILGDIMKRDYLGNIGIDFRIILKWI